MEPTLVPDEDCSGVIGGEAVADECGVCEGLGKTGCDSTCGSTLQLDCFGECGGDARRDCNNECNGTHHWEYFCTDSDDLGIKLDLNTRTHTCFTDTLTGNCNPSTDSCDFVDCEVDTMYKETVIDCSWNLPICDTTYIIENEIDIIVCNNYNSSDWLSDGSCDLTLNCKEFNFDGGDCNSNPRVSETRITKKWQN